MVDVVAAPGRSADWLAVVALGAGSFAVGTASFVVAGVLEGLAEGLDVPAGTAGLTVTVFAAASAVGSPLLGALVPARHPRPVLVGALALFGLFNVAAAVAPSLGVLLGARVLAALAAAVYVPAAGAAAVAAVADGQRGRALAVVLGGASAAMLLGAPVGVLAAAAYSWRAPFLLVAVLAAAAAAGLLRVGLPAGPAGPLSLRARLHPLRSRPVVGSLAVTLLLMAGSNSMFTYLGGLAGDVGAVGLGLMIAVFGAGGAVGTAFGGVAADRWGGAGTVRAAAGVLVAVFALWPLLGPHPAAGLALLAVWAVAAWASVPAQQHRLVELAPESAPLVLALNSSAINAGFAVGALVGGVVVDAAGPGRLWLVAAACCTAGLALHTALTANPLHAVLPARPFQQTALSFKPIDRKSRSLENPLENAASGTPVQRGGAGWLLAPRARPGRDRSHGRAAPPVPDRRARAGGRPGCAAWSTSATSCQCC
jgi:predicted MFS family arabinose efflux permease